MSGTVVGVRFVKNHGLDSVALIIIVQKLHPPWILLIAVQPRRVLEEVAESLYEVYIEGTKRRQRQKTNAPATLGHSSATERTSTRNWEIPENPNKSRPPLVRMSMGLQSGNSVSATLKPLGDNGKRSSSFLVELEINPTGELQWHSGQRLLG